MVCSKCKTPLPAGAISCPKCGTKFKTKQCPYCKSAILSNSTTCPRCGKRLTQPAAPAAQYTAASSSAKGGFRWWYILIGLGIFILGICVGAVEMRQYIISNVTNAFNQFSSSLENFGASSASSQQEQPTDSSQSEDQAPQASGDAGTLGDYDVAILEARKATDYEGKPAIIIGYRFTNNSDENQTFMVSIDSKAFQNGVQLETAIMNDETYNVEDIMKEVQPGGTLEVEKAYVLQDETNEVTAEASELISLSKEKLIKRFPLTNN